MNEDLDLTLYADAPELVTATASEIFEFISTALTAKKICHVALTGGTLGTDLAQALVARLNSTGDLSGLHLWLSDERFVDAGSPLRNIGMLRDLTNKTIVVHPVLSNDSGKTVVDAATNYQKDLNEVVLDLCVLGLGPDGHVASLFPNQWDFKDQSKVVAIINSPKPPSQRVSLSMSFINQSEQVWIVAAGDSKATAVTQVLESDPKIPASYVEGRQLTRLIVDTEAFFSENL